MSQAGDNSEHTWGAQACPELCKPLQQMHTSRLKNQTRDALEMARGFISSAPAIRGPWNDIQAQITGLARANYPEPRLSPSTS